MEKTLLRVKLLFTRERELTLDAATTCPICLGTVAEEFSHTAEKGTNVKVKGWVAPECGHFVHLDCVIDQVKAFEKQDGRKERFIFNHMDCSLCRKPFEVNSTDEKNQKRAALKLRIALYKDKILRDKVTQAVRKHASTDPYDKIEPLPSDAVINRKIGAFRCDACKSIFCESVQCQAAAAGSEEEMKEEPGDDDEDEVKCQNCRTKQFGMGKYRLYKKGLDLSKCSNPIIKCDLCCNVAVFRCHDYYQCQEHHNHCPGVKPVTCCPGPKKCPLHVQHPQNGHKKVGFPIACGCGKCRV